MSKQSEKRPPLEQPELPNIPPRPQMSEPEFKVLTVHTIKDPKQKKPDKIKVTPRGDNHTYQVYELAEKLQKILQSLKQLQYEVSYRVVIENPENNYQNFNQPLTISE